MAMSDAPTIYSVRRLDPEGGLGQPDTIPAPESAEPERVRFVDADGVRRITRVVPLVGNPTIRLGFEGDFWVTDGGERYVIHRLDLERDTLLAVERAYEPVPVPSHVRAEALTELEPPEGMRSSDNDPDRIPANYPGFNTFYPSTDGSLWVRRQVDGGLEALDVFDPDGIYLGQVDFPSDMSGFRINLITEDRIYGVGTDDLDVPAVVVLRIQRQ
ncbi:MAG: hypothetical protein EA351_00685 [Gemmatimonadales bacterium]|nr:MAG: hypothetical protein EA351_00685 [Gemmatimonadales bacterium]